MLEDGSRSMDLIKEKFNLVTTNAILQINPSHNEDKLFWKYEKSGNYSVKSGYRVAFVCLFVFFFSFSSWCVPGHFANKELWISVWEPKTPPKIKTLVWNLLHEGVLVTKKLKSKFNNVDERCAWCFFEAEFVFHFFFSWPRSKQLWDLSGLADHSRMQSNLPFWKW